MSASKRQIDIGVKVLCVIAIPFAIVLGTVTLSSGISLAVWPVTMACVTMMWALVTLLLAWLQPSLYTTPARLVDFLLGTTLIASVAVVLSSNYEMNGTGGLIGWLFFAGFASGILSLVSAALPLLDSTARYLERRRMAQR